MRKINRVLTYKCFDGKEQAEKFYKTIPYHLREALMEGIFKKGKKKFIVWYKI